MGDGRVSTQDQKVHHGSLRQSRNASISWDSFNTGYDKLNWPFWELTILMALWTSWYRPKADALQLCQEYLSTLWSREIRQHHHCRMMFSMVQPVPLCMCRYWMDYATIQIIYFIYYIYLSGSTSQPQIPHTRVIVLVELLSVSATWCSPRWLPVRWATIQAWPQMKRCPGWMVLLFKCFPALHP